MKKTIAGLAIAAASVSTPVEAKEKDQTHTITRSQDHTTSKGSPDFFTGDVSVKGLFGPKESAPFSGGIVTFQPGARSNWHTHPAGQHLVVLDGIGLTGLEDGTITEIKEGDVIWCPPGVKHWHGAKAEHAMTHMALTGDKDGKNVDWMEPVTDEQYKTLK